METKPPAKRISKWKHIARASVLGAICVGATALLFSVLLDRLGLLSPISSSLLMMFLSQPLLVLIGLQHHTHREDRRQITRYASYDALTNCLNGAVFAALIDRRNPEKSPVGQGAFLLVKANLDAVSSRFGWTWRDQAIQLIASAIRGSIRSSDVIGRIGVSEFGVFLPSATEAEAVQIGARIRSAVLSSYFAPAGDELDLDVSIGGTLFSGDVKFEEIFRSAQSRPNGSNTDEVPISRLSREPDADSRLH